MSLATLGETLLVILIGDLDHSLPLAMADLKLACRYASCLGVNSLFASMVIGKLPS